MIETNVEVSIGQSHKWLEKALQELQQAKQRVANEKKKQNEKKRKAKKQLPHNLRSRIAKTKARAIRNDKSRE